jgi:hypothetical protein
VGDVEVLQRGERHEIVESALKAIIGEVKIDQTW